MLPTWASPSLYLQEILAFKFQANKTEINNQYKPKFPNNYTYRYQFVGQTRQAYAACEWFWPQSSDSRLPDPESNLK